MKLPLYKKLTIFFFGSIVIDNIEYYMPSWYEFLTRILSYLYLIFGFFYITPFIFFFIDLVYKIDSIEAITIHLLILLFLNILMALITPIKTKLIT
jgi:hypothetical protein